MTRLLLMAFVVALLSGCQAPIPSTARSTAAAPTIPAVRCHAIAGKADRACTPGVTNPQVTQDTIGSTICRAGWTATIRPPVAYTEALKRRQVAAYGLTGSLSAYEEDHLLALEDGGDPRDPRNLFPQPLAGPSGAHAKDREENSLHAAVCSGRMTLADAQRKLITDWTHT